ncbi:MAG: hypothetical protein ACYTFZ_11235 [Planctomycetota bacterium]|jgi:DNA-binding transcriptional regulator/RsmH inhibitor MraZ
MELKMGLSEQPAGNNGHADLVRLFGYQAFLSLDARGRFRLPDDLSAAIHRELGRIQQAAASAAPVAAFERLALYFVPGTRERVFLYPAPNIHLAVESFEGPPPGMEPEVVRQARDYFYSRMRFVEADKQNRLLIPETLRLHAGIDEQVQQIALVAHNFWLALMRSELVEQRAAENLAAFEQAAPDLLNPVYRTPRRSAEGPSQTEQQS